MEIWLRIELPYACYAVIVKNDKCIATPSIARWMIGKSRLCIEAWVGRHDGSVLEMA